MKKSGLKIFLVIVIVLLLILIIQMGMLLKTVNYMDWDVRNILGKLNLSQ